MDRETARQEIREKIDCRNYLEKSKSSLYCCPYCNSGKGKHGTGAVKYYEETNTWYCHSCNEGGDVIDLYQRTTGADHNTALSLMAQEIGVTIEPYRPAIDPVERPQNDLEGQGYINMPAEQENPREGAEAATRANADCIAYYKECKERLKDPAAANYLQGRGISQATAAAYWLGYDPKADPAQSGYPCGRLIMPTSNTHYIGRRIDGQKQFEKMNPKGSTPAIFNSRVLYAQEVQEIFVTEGMFDALSVIEAGAAAISLNSAANAGALIKHLEQRRTAATLIISLDNDERGQKATEYLAAELRRLNISHITADICAGYKDPNDALIGDRAAFIATVERARQKTAARPDNTAFYIDVLMADEIEKFKDDKKTGFNNLDEKAGGLSAGLYVLAAISSLGKTSFALQLADQLATDGNHIIYFSLEQSRLELVSKSLARIKAQKSTLGYQMTSLRVRKGEMCKQVKEAAKIYKKAVSDRISIVEGNFNCNISFIGEYIRQYVRRNNARPVVFIDYLQILQPVGGIKWQSTKETIDNTVTELKRISRELNLTFIVISSVNRANYMTPIDFESLKESGGIEFTADVIWGLQLQCLHDPIFEKANNIKEKREKIKEAKAANPRKLELVCLKNRYGIANYSCYFDYYPASDLFTESCSIEQAYKEPPKAGRRL